MKQTLDKYNGGRKKLQNDDKTRSGIWKPLLTRDIIKEYEV